MAMGTYNQHKSTLHTLQLYQLTGEQLAKKYGITKAVINKAEMDAEKVKVSVLQNIIEKGLSGRLQLSVKF